MCPPESSIHDGPPEILTFRQMSANSSPSHTYRPLARKSNPSHPYAKCRVHRALLRPTEYRTRTVQIFRPSLLLSANYTLYCRNTRGRGGDSTVMTTITTKPAARTKSATPTPYSRPASCSNLPPRTLQMQEAQVTMREHAHLPSGKHPAAAAGTTRSFGPATSECIRFRRVVALP